MQPVSASQLLSYFPDGSRSTPKRVGAEFEFLGFSGGRQITYAGTPGVSQVMAAFVADGWEPVHEGPNVIAARREGAGVTLEPGGQVELSTPPRDSAVEIATDLLAFTERLREIGQELGIQWLATGMNPVSRWDEVELVPKGRYDIMTRFLQQKGPLALDMMRRTQSVHVTLDYFGPSVGKSMARAASVMVPFITGFFASSAIGEGAPVGFRSYRAQIWSQTDPDRCGLDENAVAGAWNYRAYLKKLEQMPLIFVVQAGQYIDAGGMTVGEYFSRGFNGQPAQVEDLEWVINQTFPEVRLRQYLECRSADMPALDLAPAVPAIIVGLLYDEENRRRLSELMKGLSVAELAAFQLAVARDGWKAQDSQGRGAQEMATSVLGWARESLEKRGLGEETLIEPVEALVSRGQTPADEILAQWNGPLEQDMGRLIDTLAI